MTVKKLSESDILALLQSKDKEQQDKAVQAMVQNTKYLRFAQLRCFLNLKANAEEVHQEAFFAFWRNLDHLNFSSYKEVESYLYATIRTMAKDQNKNKHNQRTQYKEHENLPSSQISESYPLERIQDEDLQKVWQEILDLIVPPCKDILYMQASGFSYKEITEYLYPEGNQVVTRKTKQTCLDRLMSLLKNKPHLKKRLETFWDDRGNA